MSEEQLEYKTEEYIVSTNRISQILKSGDHLCLCIDLYSFGNSKLKTFEISIHNFKNEMSQPEYLFKGFLSDLVSLIEDYQRLKKKEES